MGQDNSLNVIFEEAENHDHKGLKIDVQKSNPFTPDQRISHAAQNPPRFTAAAANQAENCFHRDLLVTDQSAEVIHTFRTVNKP